jgi:hypothetical protein
MYFAIASAIIAVACSAITIKTLVGYSDIRRSRKIIVGLLVVVGWFAPLLVGLVRDSGLFGPEAFAVVSKILYLMFGTVFILFSMLLFRDVVWFALYWIYSKIFGENWKLHPKNINLLDKANFIVVLLTAVLASMAVYGGAREPVPKSKIRFKPFRRTSPTAASTRISVSGRGVSTSSLTIKSFL